MLHLALAALLISSPVAPIYDGLAPGGRATSEQSHFDDSAQLTFGNTSAAPDIWIDFDGTNFCITSTNINGAGADGDLLCHVPGGNNLTISRTLYLGTVEANGRINLNYSTGSVGLLTTDDAGIGWGNSTDYKSYYEAGSTALRFLWTTNGDGAGADTQILSMIDGTDELVLHTRMTGSAAVLCLGSGDCTTNRGLGVTDIMTAGALEVDGQTYLDGTVNFNGAGGGYWNTGTFRLVDGQLRIYDNKYLQFGSGQDFFMYYDETGDDALEIWTTDSDGGGSDLQLVSLPLGTDDWIFLRDVTFQYSVGAADNVRYRLGNTAGVDSELIHSTVQTPDSLLLALGSESNTLAVVEIGDRLFDFAPALQTNPTIKVYSAAQNTTYWLSIAHDQTDGVIDVGAGDLKIADEIELTGVSGDGSGKVLCVKADGNVGTCSDAPGAGGTCTCG